jgi:hypothetical protein
MIISGRLSTERLSLIRLPTTTQYPTRSLPFNHIISLSISTPATNDERTKAEQKPNGKRPQTPDNSVWNNDDILVHHSLASYIDPPR